LSVSVSANLAAEQLVTNWRRRPSDGVVRRRPVDSRGGPGDVAIPVLVILNIERKRLIDVNPLVGEDHRSARLVQVVDADEEIARVIPLVVVQYDSDHSYPPFGATWLQAELQPSLLSFPRTRESRAASISRWMPAFAGMTGSRAADALSGPSTDSE
jgi:hypothetical protein